MTKRSMYQDDDLEGWLATEQRARLGYAVRADAVQEIKDKIAATGEDPDGYPIRKIADTVIRYCASTDTYYLVVDDDELWDVIDSYL